MSLLRRALEGETKEELVTLQGPLSAAYTTAINLALDKSKENVDVAAIATESQANDAIVQSKLITSLIEQNQSVSAPATIYGVSANQITPTEVVDVVSKIGEVAKIKNEGVANSNQDLIDEANGFVLVLDYTGPNCDANYTYPVLNALESIASGLGIKVAKSLNNALEQLLK